MSQQKKMMMSANVATAGNNNLNRFAGDAEKGIKVTPEQTLQWSVMFIAVVLVLHVLGKIVGFGASPQQNNIPEDIPETNVD